MINNSVSKIIMYFENLLFTSAYVKNNSIQLKDINNNDEPYKCNSPLALGKTPIIKREPIDIMSDNVPKKDA